MALDDISFGFQLTSAPLERFIAEGGIRPAQWRSRSHGRELSPIAATGDRAPPPAFRDGGGAFGRVLEGGQCGL
jgi:hypothetical protein